MSAFNITDYTVEEQKKMAELLQKDRKHQDYMKRKNVEKTLILRKAVEAGIKVTKEEVDAYLKAH